MHLCVQVADPLSPQRDETSLLQDLVFYTRMFQEEMKRDPTNVELFDMAQSNSEHRHVIITGCITPLIACTLPHIIYRSLSVNPASQPGDEQHVHLYHSHNRATIHPNTDQHVAQLAAHTG